MKKIFLSFYIDLENIQREVNIKDLMNDVSLKYPKEDEEPVFAVKIACGNTTSIKKYRAQLKELNFEIRETPHIASKKNRADLIISMDAFEKLYINQPPLSLFVFMTNDSDYSVVMDLLRKYGKDVWLVTNEEDSKRDIFQNSSDNILIINEYLDKASKTNRTESFKDLQSEIDRRTVNTMIRVLRSLSSDKEYDVVFLNNQFRRIDNSINLKNTQFNSFKNLYSYLSDKKVITYSRIKGDIDKVTEIDFRALKHLA